MGYWRDFKRRLFVPCNASLTISCSAALRVSGSAAPSGASNNPTWAAILRVASAAFSLPFSALDLLQHDPFKLADRPLSRALAQDHGGGERALDDGLEVRLFRGRPRGFP